MTLPDLAFLVVAALTLGGAFLAVWLRNVFYNALGLILCLFGVAGLFIFLNAEFLAVIEVIVYIGAISIAIIFAIMLSRPMQREVEARNPAKHLRAGLIAAALFFGLIRASRVVPITTSGIEGDYSMKAIGVKLLTEAVLPFEVISLVLLVAIIGALVISQLKDEA